MRYRKVPKDAPFYSNCKVLLIALVLCCSVNGMAAHFESLFFYWDTFNGDHTASERGRPTGSSPIVSGPVRVFGTGTDSVFAAGPAFAVDTTADTQDIAPGNGVCADANGMCSLRAAITEANAISDSNIITLPGGTYTESLPGPNENGIIWTTIWSADRYSCAG